MNREEGRHARHAQHKLSIRDIIYNWLFGRDLSAVLQMTGLTGLVLTVSIWQLRGYGRLSFIMHFCAVAALCSSAVYAVRFRDDAKPMLWKNTVFLLAMESAMLFFLVRNSEEIVAAIGVLRSFIVPFGYALVIGFQLFQLFFTTHRWSYNNKKVREILILSALCVIFAFILNLECFNTWPRWDSYNYFRDLEKLSARNLFLPGDTGLMVCSHISTSYALYSFFFMSLPGLTDLNALYLSNMVLLAADLVLFYMIFRRLLPNASQCIHILYAVVATCLPLVLGSVAFINAEHLLLTGTLLLIYALLSDNNILIIFSAYIICNARETGAAVAGAMIFVQLLYMFGDRKRKGKQTNANLFLFFLCLCVGVLWLLQYSTGNWFAKNNSETGPNWSRALTLIDTDKFNQLGFSLLHISDALIGELVGSFQWIFSGALILALVLFLIRRIKKEKESSSLSWKGCWIIATGLIAFLVESCAFITFNLYRYYSVFSTLLCMLGLCSIYYVFVTLWNKKVIHYIVSCVLCVLLLAQSYSSVDPVMLAIYPTFNTGRSMLPALPQHTSRHIDPCFTDAVAINRQIMYLDKALDRAYDSIFKEIDDDNIKVLCTDEYVYSPGRLGALYAIWGYGYSYVAPPMWGHWNSEGGYRYLSYDQADNIDPSYVLADTDLSSYLNDYEHVYYIEMPWGDTVIEPLMERYPDISFYQTVEYRGWVLNIYRIK